MIRLRNGSGVLLPPLPPDAVFIELVHPEDHTVQLVFAQLNPGEVLEIRPGSDAARRYEALLQGSARFTAAEIRRAPA